MATNVLVYGDTVTSPALRHEVPVAIGDAFLYLESHGQSGRSPARDRPPGSVGFYFALGHGVGLEVHEAPMLGRIANNTLIEGDVIAAEPGTSVSGLGGCRVEDLLRASPQGSERPTGTFPYDLVPREYLASRQTLGHPGTILAMTASRITWKR